MRIEVDRDACVGHGRCWSLVPELFDGDDNGYCATESFDVPEGFEPAARRAVAGCPERAIVAH
jgi:ferredoxin